MSRLLKLSIAICLLSTITIQPAYSLDHSPADLLDIMQVELNRSMDNLASGSEVPMYYLQYAVNERVLFNLAMINGGFTSPKKKSLRLLDVDLRVGSMELDSTHEIRGGNWRDNYAGHRIVNFPLDEDKASIAATLWNETEYQYRKAQERYTKVLNNRQVKVEEEDLSDDFSPGEPHQYTEPIIITDYNENHWREFMRPIGQYLAFVPFVKESNIRFSIQDNTTYLVNSDGCRLQHGNHYHRLALSIDGMAADGMVLSRSQYYSAATIDNFPDIETVMADAERLVAELEMLINAPVVEPYIGPAILRHRASGVFFHEIFGHRIEGHRQKSESEGQTFTKKVGQQILPEFISIYDDATLKMFGKEDLRGFYKFDDEGTPAERVTVVEKGVLKNFLTTRSPINNFPKSNGHGRRQAGFDVVARQGNLIVTSEKRVPYDELRALLIEECKRQNKPYGLIFDDISGGFTMTGRGGPQAFKVNPLLVYRVHADGRPDEVVRGVDIVGTPLTCFSKILMAAQDDAVFNGTCGAESGSVPVSAVSPSLLVAEIEVEKRRKGQDRPPILPPPGMESSSGSDTADPVFAAMESELQRSMDHLFFDEMPKPYFLSYKIQDNDFLQVTSRYGSLINTNHQKNRYLYIDLRVGDPARDNSYFVHDWRDLYNRRDELPVGDNINSLRHHLWHLTDGAYKTALENLSRKEAYLQAHPPKEEIPDMAGGEPHIHLEEPVPLNMTPEQWEDEISAVAGVLREFEGLQDWEVDYAGVSVNKHFINSEGSKTLSGFRYQYLEVTATAQAPDGQRLSNFYRIALRGDDTLPEREQLHTEVRKMAAELQEMVAAPSLDEYAGPVLFSGFASAQIISQLFVSQLSPAREPIVAEEWMKSRIPDPKLAGRLNRRIFPEFILITDEPSREKWDGMSCIGHRAIDDEGVACRDITLIKEGRLVTIPMTRRPTKRLAETNGHARTLQNQWTVPGITTLVLDSGKTKKDLHKELRKLCKEFGNEYGLLITRINDPDVSRSYQWTDQNQGGDALLEPPIVMYRVYTEDGRVEAVRGLGFDEVTIRMLRDIAILGKDPKLYNFRQPSGFAGTRYPASIITPSILIEEMEFTDAMVREPLPLSENPIFTEN